MEADILEVEVLARSIQGPKGIKGGVPEVPGGPQSKLGQASGGGRTRTANG